MSSVRKDLGNVLRLAMVALLGAGALAVTPSAAQAGGTGNTVFNCYGIWWSTDWDQRCAWPGAGLEGNYHSYADCNNEWDPSIDVYRGVGDNREADGADCVWSARWVGTSYS